MNAIELRSQIELALSGMIGSYRLPNGMVTPAIAVLKSYDVYPPEGTKITGLEVVIMYPTALPTATFEGYKVERNWTVYLKQWDRQGSLIDVVRSFFSIPSFVKKLIFVPPSESLGIPEMVTATVCEFSREG